MQELLSLLREAGHTDLRDARGPMRFTQRQAGGRFTRDEAAASIDQLRAAELTGEPVAAVAAPPSPQEQLLRRLPSEQLAAELSRRGWTVTEP